MSSSMPRLHPVVVLAIVALLLVALGTPLISYWVSFFVLGKIAPVARLLQVSAQPIFPMLPGLCVAAVVLAGSLLIGRRGESVRAVAWFGAGLAGVMVASSVLAIWFFALLSLPRYQIHPVAFDAAKWAAADCATTRVRQQMLADLDDQLKGKTQAEVKALIGEPTDGRTSYCLGPEPHVIAVDREFMQVLFTRDGLAAELKISAN